MDSLQAAPIFPLEYVNKLTLIKPERKRRGWSAINGISDRSLGHRFKITDILEKKKKNFNRNQESITRSVYLTHDYVLGLWVNRFAWIN